MRFAARYAALKVRSPRTRAFVDSGRCVKMRKSSGVEVRYPPCAAIIAPHADHVLVDVSSRNRMPLTSFGFRRPRTYQNPAVIRGRSSSNDALHLLGYDREPLDERVKPHLVDRDAADAPLSSRRVNRPLDPLPRSRGRCLSLLFGTRCIVRSSCATASIFVSSAALDRGFLQRELPVRPAESPKSRRSGCRSRPKTGAPRRVAGSRRRAPVRGATRYGSRVWKRSRTPSASAACAGAPM
jgi:hypothetical protein